MAWSNITITYNIYIKYNKMGCDTNIVLNKELCKNLYYMLLKYLPQHSSLGRFN